MTTASFAAPGLRGWRPALALLGLALLAAGCASSPPQMMASPAAAAAAASNTPDTVVCRREEDTGSRITATRCRKVAEVEARRNRDKEMAENIPTVVPDIR